MIVAVVFTGAAVVAALRHADQFAGAIDGVLGAPAVLVVAAATLPLLNYACTTGTFWVLTRPLARVSFAEMAALMGASWLANHLPLKPGLVGRLAYHKAVHRIPIRDSASTTIQSFLLGGLAATAMIGAAMLMTPGTPGTPGSTVGWSVLAAVVLAGTAGGMYARRAGVRTVWNPGLGVFTAAMAFRLADAAVWVLRYAVVFELVGSPITLAQAAALAAVTQAVAAVPVLGSALGVREWVVAALAGSLPAAHAASPTLGSAMTAELINRVVEVSLAVVIGSVCSAWLIRRISAPPPGAVAGMHAKPLSDSPSRDRPA